MKKVMLLGDSIRLSYRQRVAEILAGEATIHGPDDNCRFSAYTLFNLRGWVPDEDYDVIHWNNGQWDTCYMPDGKIHTPLDAYVQLQVRIAAILGKKAKRLIFATTTPVHADMFQKAPVNPRKNEDIEVYNRTATDALSGLGVEINDLYTPLAEDIPTFISEDRVHLTPAGVDRCAVLVVAQITR